MVVTITKFLITISPSQATALTLKKDILIRVKQNISTSTLKSSLVAFWCDLQKKKNAKLIQPTWRLGWQPRSRRTLTTPICPLLTPMCNGVWRRLLRALRSAPPRCNTFITSGSSPNAAWWTARSPSLSWNRHLPSIITHLVSCVNCQKSIVDLRAIQQYQSECENFRHNGSKSHQRKDIFCLKKI